MLPTISYMTSLDRYQIVCIIYLVSLCIYNAILASLTFDIKIVEKWDFLAMGIFFTLFILIQVSFSTSLYFAFRKIKVIREREAKYIELKTQNDNDYDDDEIYNQL
jgi:hypothetical protein